MLVRKYGPKYKWNVYMLYILFVFNKLRMNFIFWNENVYLSSVFQLNEHVFYNESNVIFCQKKSVVPHNCISSMFWKLTQLLWENFLFMFLILRHNFCNMCLINITQPASKFDGLMTHVNRQSRGVENNSDTSYCYTPFDWRYL